MTAHEAMRAAFLADIVANPADDASRLIYADWLDDHGEPERAEFIRCQCWLARNGRANCAELSARWCPVCGDCSCPRPEESLDSEGCPLHAGHSWHACAHEREAYLLSVNATEWGDDVLPGAVGWHAVQGVLVSVCPRVIHFRRGFAAEVDCDWPAWEKHGPDIVTRHPVERVTLPGVVRGMGGLPTIWRGGGDGDLPADVFAMVAAEMHPSVAKCMNQLHVAAGTHLHFSSTDLAVNCVSRGVLAWARAEAARRKGER